MMLDEYSSAYWLSYDSYFLRATDVPEIVILPVKFADSSFNVGLLEWDYATPSRIIRSVRRDLWPAHPAFELISSMKH